MGVFASIGETITSATTSLINNSISNITSELTPVITTGVIIYFMITGYMVMAGRISEPISDICIKGFKISLIASIALNSGNIMSYVVGTFNGVEQMFVRAISGDGSADTYQILDDIFNKSIDTASQAVTTAQELGITDIGEIIALYVTAGLIGLATLATTGMGGAIIILAKVALAVIFGVAPFFLAGLMFPVTARWADAWLNQALNYSLVSAIVIFVLTLTVRMFDSTISIILDEVNDGNSFPCSALFDLLLISAFNTYVIKQAPAIASGLAGGAASAGASLTGLVGRAKQMGSWYDSAIAAARTDGARLKKATIGGAERITGISKTVERIRGNRIGKI